MSTHVLFKCEACRVFNPFFETSLINSMIQEHDTIYHMAFKSIINRI